MPCLIRDHYEIFRRSVLPEQVGAEDEKAREALESEGYLQTLKEYDVQLQDLMFIAAFDRVVPAWTGRQLRRAIGGPKTIYLLAGHYTSFLYLTCCVPR
jgi:hypothetical protein